MPLYELLCLARPALQRAQLAAMMAKVGALVQARGGVVTNVTSFGKQPLAYRIKGVHGKHEEAHIWSLDFAVSPAVLAELNLQMRVNEDVLRYAVVRRELPRLPSPRALYHKLPGPERAALLRPPPRHGQQQP